MVAPEARGVRVRDVYFLHPKASVQRAISTSGYRVVGFRYPRYMDTFLNPVTLRPVFYGNPKYTHETGVVLILRRA